MKQRLIYTVREVVPYINWIYYFHAWGMEPRFSTVTEVHDFPSCRAGWIASFPTEEQAKAREAMKLYDEAKELLARWADEPICHAIFLLADAYSEEDDIVIDGAIRIPFLRQQRPEREGYTLCLSDFIRPKEKNSIDRIGVFATTVSPPFNPPLSTFNFRNVISEVRLHSLRNCKQACISLVDTNFQLSTLSDRLAEATAEKMHEEVRKHYWGYAKDEQLTMHELHAEKFQGIRPAVGYPSLPDQSVSFIIDELLHLSDIGITLSEHGAMHPHCSVSGFMFAHPAAHYFAVGEITEEQLRDYSQRRKTDISTMRKFLYNIQGT